MNITIAKELREKYPDVKLLVFYYNTTVKKSNKKLLNEIDETISSLQKKYELPDIVQIPAILDTRNAYKKLGKSPSSYRNSSEAMLRRILKGKSLYTINNIVDVNNLVSILSGYSVGSYDCNKLSKHIYLKQAPKDEAYTGIGKKLINIENLPTLYDDNGAFGNPTSDSNRAIIDLDSYKIMSVVYCFSKNDDLTGIIDLYRNFLTKYCDVENLVFNKF